MKLKSQKRTAAQLLKIGRNRVWFDKERLSEIKEAITKADIRKLIKDLAIQARPSKGISGYRTKKNRLQKRKGRRQGPGSRKGTSNARLSRKKSWKERIRVQRRLLKKLREKEYLTPKVYRELYRKSKGGFFRSRRHILIYLEERGLLKKAKIKKEKK